MRVLVLGTMEIRDGAGRTVPLRGRRMPALLARLALSPQEVVPTEVLLDELWDGAPPGGGAQTLRRLAARARALLSDAGLTVGPCADGGGYLLDVPQEQVDVHRFAHLASEGSRLLRLGAADRALLVCEDALALWRGAPFGGIDADFADHERRRLEELHLRTVEDRLHALAGTGETGGLVTELQDLCRAHPAREGTHALLIRTLARDGETAAALAAYERLRAGLADELGADPSPELRALHDRLLRGDDGPSPRPPIRYLTRFVGRDRELSTVEGLFERTRLVTLVGPGGVGKTRLAHEHANRRGGDRPCFVDLAPLREGDDLAAAVSAAVGGTDEPLIGADGDRLPPLVSALQAGPPLLILDNCEHLAAPVAELTETLLSACPQLTVLATAREPLGITGEALLRIDPLDTTGTHSDAAVLFSDLATLARPGLELTAADRTVVAEICRRLDGLPLVIELAASRVRSMSLVSINRHLDERFRLLDGPRRTGDRRHRTLLALLDWTWNLLDAPEQRLASRISLLPGGATEASAAALAEDDGRHARELLASLVDKSLLHRSEGRDGQPDRYRLLETPRLYLAERLRAREDEHAAADRADRCFLHLAEEASDLLLGRDQPQGLARFDAERDNLAATLRRLLDRGDVGAAARMVTALGYYWLIRGRYDDLERWTAPLRHEPSPLDGPTRSVISALHAVLPRHGSADGAPERTSPAPLDRAAAEAFPPLISVMTKARLMDGDLSRARADTALAMQHPDPRVRAAGTAAAALVDEADGDVAGAERGAADALELFQHVGDIWASAQMAVLLAGFRSLRGDVVGAVDNLRSALDRQRSLDLHGAIPATLVRCGQELSRAGHPDEAEARFREALEATPPSNDVRLFCLLGLARLALDRDDLAGSRRLLDDARTLLDAPLADAEHLAVVLRRHEASLALREDDTARAHRLADEAWRAAEQLTDAVTRAEAAELLAETLLHTGEPERAARMLGMAAGIRGVRDEGSPRVRSVGERLAAELGERTYLRAYRGGEARPLRSSA